MTTREYLREVEYDGLVIKYRIEWDYHEILNWNGGICTIEPYYKVVNEDGVEIEDWELLETIKKYEGL